MSMVCSLGDPSRLLTIGVQGVDESVVTEYVVRMLGLEVCADTKVGNQMIRGISGGQKKRVTSGEMLVSAKRVRQALLLAAKPWR
jgi:ABC-type multidrug transport system ATPase subunit